MTDKEKPGKKETAGEQVEKPNGLKELIKESGFIDVTKPGRTIGFVGAGGCTPPDSTPEKKESSTKH